MEMLFLDRSLARGSLKSTKFVASKTKMHRPCARGTVVPQVCEFGCATVFKNRCGWKFHHGLYLHQQRHGAGPGGGTGAPGDPGSGARRRAFHGRVRSFHHQGEPDLRPGVWGHRKRQWRQVAGDVRQERDAESAQASRGVRAARQLLRHRRFPRCSGRTFRASARPGFESSGNNTSFCFIWAASG